MAFRNLDIRALLLKKMEDLQKDGKLPPDVPPEEAFDEWLSRKIEREFPTYGDAKVEPEDIAPGDEQSN